MMETKIDGINEFAKETASNLLKKYPDIDFYDLMDKPIDDASYLIAINETDYKSNKLKIVAPVNCRKLVVRLCADTDSVLFFDDLSLKIIP